jgi:hypothetical protein
MSWLSKLLPKSVTATLTRQDVRKALGRNGVPVAACDEIDALLARYAPAGLRLTIKL